MDCIFLEILYNEKKYGVLEKISQVLEEYEIFDFELKEPMKRNPLDYYSNNLEISPDYYAVKIYLEENFTNQKIVQELEKKMASTVGIISCIKGRFEEKEWKDKWKEYFKPTKIGKTIVVRPIWEEYCAKDGENVIAIDPKMAFGTGTHATTAHCLRFIEKYVKNGNSVLDIGTGSSILLIASKIFGANKLVGIDIDSEALESAKVNLKLNNVFPYTLAKTFENDRTFDVVIANIICEVLIELFEAMIAKMNDQGLLFLSGILEEKSCKMEELIHKHQLKIVEKSLEDGWLGYVCKKNC